MTPPKARERAETPRTVLEGRKAARDRVRAVQTATASFPDEGYLAQTPNGLVHIASISFGKDDHVEWVDVTLAGVTEANDPHFRIYNPPLLVPDPVLGDVEVRGVRYRMDPLAALADLIGQHGGAQGARKGSR